MSLPKSIVDTVGIEIESSFLTQDAAINLIRNSRLLGNWRVHNDASINTTRSSIPGLGISFNSVNGQMFSRRTYGAEIVSPPIDTTEDESWKDQVKELLGHIYKTGEIPQKETSIHIHVNSAGIPVYFVQNLLRLWQGLEASIYRLGIAESGIHRGELREDYKYCRPLSSPHVVLSDNCLRYSYSVDKMLSAKTYADFFTAYGNVSLSREANKYHPARYSGLNFFSLQSINTVEFRVFNMTTNWKNVVAWIELCKSMLRQSMGKPIDLEKQDLGFSGEFNIPRLQSILEFDDETAIQLEYLWNNSDWPNPVKGNFFTHSNHSTIKWAKLKPEKVESALKWNGDFSNKVTYESLTGSRSLPAMPAIDLEPLETEDDEDFDEDHDEED